ncbi:hypothetical protein EW146_g7886 [Bondarzewia mesenterica]|uniref:Uncharacterized protein n=1 Tax=Bondarzewia mesenterica TaxID=1095465 RepID=A0A4S4LJ83_9AGAM|nr:hypothetical protein EW146_g7886 [Bondarzewia mesenterica]
MPATRSIAHAHTGYPSHAPVQTQLDDQEMPARGVHLPPPMERQLIIDHLNYMGKATASMGLTSPSDQRADTQAHARNLHLSQECECKYEEGALGTRHHPPAM